MVVSRNRTLHYESFHDFLIVNLRKQRLSTDLWLAESETNRVGERICLPPITIDGQELVPPLDALAD